MRKAVTLPVGQLPGRPRFGTLPNRQLRIRAFLREKRHLCHTGSAGDPYKNAPGSFSMPGAPALKRRYVCEQPAANRTEAVAPGVPEGALAHASLGGRRLFHGF